MSSVMELQTFGGESAVKPITRLRHPPQERVCVLVLGMHRSGTSALTRTLSLLGCDMPRMLVPANANNEPGYWESKAVIDLNNRILDSAGSQWDDWREVNPGWFASPKAAEFREEAVQLLQTEVGRSHLFALKDPRICRLAPFWAEVLQSQDISPRVVLPIRNPLEVASSVSRMKGIHPAVVHLIWLRHVLDAERFSRGMPRHFTSYEGLLKDWRPMVSDGARTLGLSWPRLSDQAGHEISAFLSDKYRHHQESARALLDDSFMSSWFRDTYQIMERWASGCQTTADQSALDRIRAEFDAASPAFSTALTEGVQAAKKLTSTRRDLVAAKSDLEERQQSGQQLSAETEDLKRQLAQLHQQLAQAGQALDQRAQQESAVMRNAQDWQSRAEAAGRELAMANSRLLQLEAAAGRSREAADKTAAALAEARAQGATAQVLADSRDEALRLQGVQLRGMEAELSDARARSKEWREHAEALGRELAEARNRLAMADSATSRQREDTDRATSALSEARSQLAAAQASLSLREEELQRRALQTAELQAELAAARQAGVEASTTVGELRAQMAQSQQTAAEHQYAAAQSAKVLAAAMQEQAELRTRLAQLEEVAARRYEVQQQQAARADQAEDDLATTRSELALALASFQDAQAQLTAMGSELAAMREEAAAAAQALGKRALELEAAVQEAADRQESARLAHEQLQAANTRLAQAKAEAARLNDSAAKARATMDATQRENQALAARLCAQEARLVDLEQDKRVAEQVTAGLKERLTAVIDEKAALRHRLAQLEEVSARQDEVRQHHAARADQAEAELAATRTELAAAREDAAAAAQTLGKRALELETAAREAADRQESVRLANEQLHASNTRLAQAKAEAARLNASAAKSQAAMDATQRENQALAARLCTQEARLVDLEQDKRVAEQVMAGLKQRLTAVIDEGAGETARLRAAQQSELASRAEALARSEASLDRVQKDLAAARNQLSRELETSLWLRKTASILSNGTETRKGRLWGMAPANWRRAKQMRQLKHEGLFDAEAYLAANPDVAQKGQDPLRHYVRYGLKDGRIWRTGKTS